MLNKYLIKALYLTLTLVVVTTPACSLFPGGQSAVSPLKPLVQDPHVRRIQTPSYVGARGAIIFTVQLPGDNKLNATTDKIIRLFAEKTAPLDIAIPPAISGDYSNYMFLRPYIDSGVIDISINGNTLSWLDLDTTKTDPSYIKLQSMLQQCREETKFLFGDTPNACVFPAEYFTQENYLLLQDTGFKILSLPYDSYYNFSMKPLGWSGEVAPDGLFRLPIIGSADFAGTINKRIPVSTRTDPDKKLMGDVSQAINDLGIAVIKIDPLAFTKEDNSPDSEKLSELTTLVESCRSLGEITTFQTWHAYISRWTTGNPGIKRVMPPYDGGTAIIFRMDDVSVGWHEDVVEAIIKIFEKNGVPVDLGIVSNVDGTKSYEMPWLKKYLEKGIIGISVHGYDWTYYQFDTTHDFQSRTLLNEDTCSLYGAAEEQPPPKEVLTYAHIKLKLMQARDAYLQYFGVVPVALTVPTDYYDETGYKAIQDAGFKIFATQITADPHPSIILVDYFGQKTPDGMYRIPTATDVCTWDKCTWGDIFDISKLMEIQGYCKYHAAWDNIVYNDFGAMLCGLLGNLGVAAI
ncbi:MAG: DUF2334 domain-containing protein, partial [Dehalococcoidia bacterium]